MKRKNNKKITQNISAGIEVGERVDVNAVNFAHLDLAETRPERQPATPENNSSQNLSQNIDALDLGGSISPQDISGLKIDADPIQSIDSQIEELQSKIGGYTKTMQEEAGAYNPESSSSYKISKATTVDSVQERIKELTKHKENMQQNFLKVAQEKQAKINNNFRSFFHSIFGRLAPDSQANIQAKAYLGKLINELKSGDGLPKSYDENNAVSLELGPYYAQNIQDCHDNINTYQQLAKLYATKEKIQTQQKSATDIQKTFRGHVAREKQAKENKENSAATDIQKAARGYIAREKQAQQNKAATDIQKTFRGQQGRNQAEASKKISEFIDNYKPENVNQNILDQIENLRSGENAPYDLASVQHRGSLDQLARRAAADLQINEQLQQDIHDADSLNNLKSLLNSTTVQNHASDEQKQALQNKISQIETANKLIDDAVSDENQGLTALKQAQNDAKEAFVVLQKQLQRTIDMATNKRQRLQDDLRQLQQQKNNLDTTQSINEQAKQNRLGQKDSMLHSLNNELAQKTSSKDFIAGFNLSGLRESGNNSIQGLLDSGDFAELNRAITAATMALNEEKQNMKESRKGRFYGEYEKTPKQAQRENGIDAALATLANLKEKINLDKFRVTLLQKNKEQSADLDQKITQIKQQIEALQ